MENIKYKKGEKILVKTPYGPICAGMTCTGTTFTPAGADKEACVFTRIWDQAYMYPNFDMTQKPIVLTDDLYSCNGITAVDWNHDGVEDFVISSSTALLWLYEQTVKEDGSIFLENRGLIKDYKTGYNFNIPFYHREYGYIDDLSGYVSLAFFNYTFPAHYPGRRGRVDLIIGDTAGKLWWLPDESEGNDPPKYSGETYKKDEDLLKNDSGHWYNKTYGEYFAKPSDELLDENGNPFVLGIVFEHNRKYNGGNTKPFTIYNDETGLYDLLVPCGYYYEMKYLKCLGLDGNGKPTFRDMGAVTPDLMLEKPDSMVYHFSHSFSAKEKKLYINDIGLGTLEYDFDWENGMPTFKNARKVFGYDTDAKGYLTEYILRDDSTGKEYINDFPNRLILHEIERGKDGVKIAYEPIRLKYEADPNVKRLADHLEPDRGSFNFSSSETALKADEKLVEPKGETDPQGLENWGFHRSAIWNWDGSGKNHIIIGTDTGNLLLVTDIGEYFTTGLCKLSDYLKDSEDNVIKLHNRSKAIAFDLDGDGREDLIVGGQSYQLGVPKDPCPGSEFVAFLNRGADENGLPILEKIPLILHGHEYITSTNKHVHLFTEDIDEDGETEVILVDQRNDNMVGRIFKKVPDKTELYYTGSYIEYFSIDDSLMDIDGDGKLEIVFGGGETGFVQYYKIEKEEIK
ncbi:MAG: hypothetical protein FWF15_00585 [Oscillospiraceae bacterium]|nr:hypothetical protein [Oscillospiraceae bacterium]